MGREDYQERQDARRERLERAAERRRQEAEDCHRRSDQLVAPIPLGQPILVGHHSEKGHRRTLERAQNLMFKMVDKNRQAEALEAKAAAVGRGGISSDDPEAIEKLRAKLERRRKYHHEMKTTNAAYRKAGKPQPDDTTGWERFLLIACAELEKPREELAEPFEKMRVTWSPYSWEQQPFPAYLLSNNNANMKRIEKRIKALEADADAEEIIKEGDGWRIEERPDLNRVLVYIDYRLTRESFKRVRSWYGFRWMRSEGCFSRHLNESGRHAAQTVVQELHSGTLERET